jgi:hypothetical protein
MDAPARQFCPLCRGELCVADAVRTHLIVDHKRSAAEADELIARFDIAKPIPEPELEPHMYCAAKKPGSDGRLSQGGGAAPEVPVN